MSTVLLVGAGQVGARAGRQLVDTPGLERLLVADRDADRARSLASQLGADVVPFALPGPVPSGVDAVAVAVPPEPALAVARAALHAGVSVAASTDEERGVNALLHLDEEARATGVSVVVGCGLAPGLADVLACHAAAALDVADEIHVARAGVAGEASSAALRKARRERPLEWRDGELVSERRRGAALVWFPEPVGARSCATVASGIPLLLQALPSATRITVRFGEHPARSSLVAFVARRAGLDVWGATRVEVWGWRDGVREVIVYGAVDRPAVAAGTVLAVAAARLAGLLASIPLRRAEPGGAFGLGSLVEPSAFLVELARRGVRAATFEGVAVA